MKNGETSTCPVCGRALIDGPSVEHHHVVPKSHGGTRTLSLHAVCHRMLHKLFDEAMLAALGGDFDQLRNHPELAKFVHWVRKKPPTYTDFPRTKGRKPYHAARR